MICPACDGDIDAHMASPWGTGPDPNQSQRITPWICAWCASLFVMDWQRKALLSPVVIKRLHNVDVLAAMKQNKILWRAISEAREKILATPNRRPVLHPEVIEEPHQ